MDSKDIINLCAHNIESAAQDVISNIESIRSNKDQVDIFIRAFHETDNLSGCNAFLLQQLELYKKQHNKIHNIMLNIFHHLVKIKEEIRDLK